MVPAFLDPTNMFPVSLSAICLGVSILSTNISIEKPGSTFRLLIIEEESALILEGKNIITIVYKKNL